MIQGGAPHLELQDGSRQSCELLDCRPTQSSVPIPHEKRVRRLLAIANATISCSNEKAKDLWISVAAVFASNSGGMFGQGQKRKSAPVNPESALPPTADIPNPTLRESNPSWLETRDQACG